MKYFLTGATGFLGGQLTKMLIEKGDEVVAVVRDTRKAEKLQSLGVKIYKGDITNKESMHEPMKGCDGVFHVAAWYKVGARDKSPAWKINVEGTRNVLELMKELNIPIGVYTSTLAINSDTNGKLVDESYHYSGEYLSEYERTKAKAHEIAMDFIREGLPLVIVMPGLIYGPDGTSLSDEALRLFLKKKLPVIPKKSALCWGHVEDTARAHILAMEKAAAGSKYIIAGPKYELVEAFGLASEITGIKKPMTVPPVMLKISAALSSIVDKLLPLPEMYSPETLRVQAGVTYIGDSSKAINELGFNPRPLHDGLKETLMYEMGKMKGRNG